jgi:hypothetical protein
MTSIITCPHWAIQLPIIWSIHVHCPRVVFFQNGFQFKVDLFYIWWKWKLKCSWNQYQQQQQQQQQPQQSISRVERKITNISLSTRKLSCGISSMIEKIDIPPRSGDRSHTHTISSWDRVCHHLTPLYDYQPGQLTAYFFRVHDVLHNSSWNPLWFVNIDSQWLSTIYFLNVTFKIILPWRNAQYRIWNILYEPSRKTNFRNVIFFP